jgi:Tfp pilus assembly protein PilW
MAAVLSLMSSYEKTYVGEQQRDDQRDALRGAAELMTQEIGQAGYLGFASSQLTSAILIVGSQPAVLSSSASTPYIFTGEKLLVDAGPSEELVTVVAASGTTVTANFAKTHAAGAPINALGAFPTGVLSTTNGSTLDLYGDINSDGTLQYVEYKCDTTAGTLTRSMTPATLLTMNAADIVLDHLVANPGGAPCFQFQTQTNSGTTYVTSVFVTLTVQTAAKDPTTGVYQSLKYSFEAAPRNVLAALALAQVKDTDRLQPTPPVLP